MRSVNNNLNIHSIIQFIQTNYMKRLKKSYDQQHLSPNKRSTRTAANGKHFFSCIHQPFKKKGHLIIILEGIGHFSADLSSSIGTLLSLVLLMTEIFASYMHQDRIGFETIAILSKCVNI